MVLLIYKIYNLSIRMYTSHGITRWCYEKKCTAKMFIKNNYIFIRLEKNHTADHSLINYYYY